MNIHRGENLYQGFLDVASRAVPYFSQWTYDQPLFISPETNRQMHALKDILYKAACHFVDNYAAYQHLMPLADEYLQLLALYKDKPYRPETLRTDFLIDEYKQIQLIEINARFPLNGLFISGFTHLIADQFLIGRPDILKIDDYTPFYDYFCEYLGKFEHICYLRGVETKNEAKYAVPIFQKAGYPVHCLRPDEIADHLDLLENAVIFSEMVFPELLKLPVEIIRLLIEHNLHTDLRSAILIHDKRFFAVLGNEKFLRDALSRAEIVEIQKHLVPTWGWADGKDCWQRARADKDSWVVKHRASGKSHAVFAGCVTADQEWQALFSMPGVEDMVLQPFVSQMKINGCVKGQPYEDYVVGTMLIYNDRFFGPGIFRASSHPVTNKVDDRKIAPLVTDSAHLFPGAVIL